MKRRYILGSFNFFLSVYSYIEFVSVPASVTAAVFWKNCEINKTNINKLLKGAGNVPLPLSVHSCIIADGRSKIIHLL